MRVNLDNLATSRQSRRLMLSLRRYANAREVLHEDAAAFRVLDCLSPLLCQRVMTGVQFLITSNRGCLRHGGMSKRQVPVFGFIGFNERERALCIERRHAGMS